MKNNVKEEDYDYEWLILIKEAKEIGLTILEIRDYLDQATKK